MLRAGVLAASALLLVACSAGPAPSTTPAPTTAPTTAAPPEPVAVCTNQLTYWAGEDLRGEDGAGFDYQHRGLSSEQNDALIALVEQARAGAWSPQQLTTAARTACEAVVAADPTGY
ncbi:MAG TPA: hypothetical protein VEZ42_21665 [Pseudonocardia sp.]|nr:hypothetical protein [Pseudonocardia sp.]